MSSYVCKLLNANLNIEIWRGWVTGTLAVHCLIDWFSEIQNFLLLDDDSLSNLKNHFSIFLPLSFVIFFISPIFSVAVHVVNLYVIAFIRTPL